jgi:hypothetical protein
VSEVFPLEIRAPAISIFYPLGTLIGGVGAPALFGGAVTLTKCQFRSWRIIFMPDFGRRVAEGSISIVWFGAGIRRNLCAIVASRSVASIIAKPVPTQTRGRLPKEKQR